MADSLEKLVFRLSSKNSTQIYDALVKARSIHVKGRTGILQFCSLGGIKSLLSVIHRHPVISQSCIITISTDTDSLSCTTNPTNANETETESGECQNTERSNCDDRNYNDASDVKLEKDDKELLKIKSLESRNTRILDVAFSLLANCCTESLAREEVVKAKGIGIIVSAFKFCDVDSISSRVCRTLANLAQSRDCVKRIIKYDSLIETVVKRLTDSSNVDSQQNYIRMFRLLGDTPDNRELIVEAEGIRPIAELLKSEHDGLVNVCIRALDDLTRECSVGCCRQMLEADCLRRMLELLTSENPSIRKHAMSTLAHITEQDSIRPSLGNAGGIKCFIDFITAESNPEKSVAFVNCLCLCCQEVVNRMKIREASGLQLLLSKLKDDKFKRLHPRIISAFVHFCTNEMGMKILLDSGLVESLMMQLQLCTDTKVLDFENLLDSVYSAYDSASVKYDSLEEVPNKNSKILTSDSCLLSASDIPVNESSTCRKNDAGVQSEIVDLSCCRTRVDMPEVSVQDISVNEIEMKPPVDEKEKSSDEEFVPVVSMTQNDIVRYSIDSPTYKTVEWSSNDYFKGPKCLGYFDAPYVISSSSSSSPSHDYMNTEPFSPLSTHSLMSSSVCSDRGVSPAYSSFSDFSDGKVSYIDSVSPRYSPSFDQSSEPNTPLQNILNDNPHNANSPNLDIKDKVIQSEKKTILPVKQHASPKFPKSPKNLPTACPKLGSLDFKAPGKTACSVSVPTVDSEFQYRQIPEPKVPDQVLRMVLLSKEYEEKDRTLTAHKVNPFATGKFRKRTLSDSRNFCNDSNSSTSSNITKGRPKRKKHEDPKKFTERNILYMLSSVSHMESAEKYLVSSQTMDVLLSYALLSGMNSHSRCWRLFDRLTKHLDCFQPLLEMNFPLRIFHLFCQPGVRTVSKLCIRSQKCDNENVLNSTDITTNCIVEETVNTKIASATSTCKTSEKIESESTECMNSIEHWRAIDSLNEKGHSLLENLLMIAEGGYGRGVLYSSLINGSPETQLLFAVNASYICRSSFLLRKVFVEYKGLEKLLNALTAQPLKEDVLHAVSYLLCQLSNIAATKTSLKNIFKDHDKNQGHSNASDCFYTKAVEKHDLSFVCSDGKIVTVEKSRLSNKSEVFSAMLNGNFTESNHSEIKLPDISSETMVVYLHLIYNCVHSNCSVIQEEYSWDTNIQLLGMADRFLAKDLQEFVIMKLTKTLRADYLVQTCRYAVFYKSMKLLEKCIIFMLTSKFTFKIILGFMREIAAATSKNEIVQHILKISKMILD